MSIGDWLGRREQLSPNKIALIDTLNSNRAISYREWNRNTNRMANFLRETTGIQKGDRVAVLSFNCIEYLEIWFALGKLGAVLQNLNWRLAPNEISRMVADAKPKALVYGAEHESSLEMIREQNPFLEHFIALGDPAAETDTPISEQERFNDAPPPAVELEWDDPWVICYTGGTSGTPKGALLTYKSITANAVNTIISWGITPDDVTVLNAPLFHTGGLNVFTAPLVYLGGTSILCKDFHLEQTFDLLTSGEVSIWFGVPTMFIMMQNHPHWESADFSHLKLCISGGAPCPMPVFEKFWAKGVDFKTGYGLTEAGPNTFWLPPEDVHRKPGSVGRPLFHVDVKVMREDGNECSSNEIGELVIRGPHVFKGYWNDPAATDESFHPLPNDPSGSRWLHTGDLARHDDEGYYYIVGRSKDMFISGGENVYPAEIENVLYGHSAVSEVAVIAVPHPTWGEVGRAIVVSKPGENLTEEILVEFLGQSLARYKIPKSFVFVQELPKTGANKVDKQQLINDFGEEEIPGRKGYA
jgi:fatty-acyl-CoA synthase